MRKRGLWLIAVVLLVVVATVALAACGGSSTATTAGVTTTAGVAPTAGAATTATTGTPTTAGGSADAAALFAQTCAGCHQSTPRGSADIVEATIKSGRGGMPAFSGKLTPEQISALAAWVANGGK